MSQARGKMFDQVLHYLFQNISADNWASRDEKERLSNTEELRIEVSVVKDPASEDQERIIKRMIS